MPSPYPPLSPYPAPDSTASPHDLYEFERRRQKRRVRLQILLFFATVLSTTVMFGWTYSASLISILLFHEMGHYFAARRYGVAATLPYFIPAPLISPFGTFGAVIRMGGVIPNRKALFDIGIMGPLLGVVVALPITFYGIAKSQLVLKSQLGPDVTSLGDSILFSLIARWIHGPLPDGVDILLDPVGYAGWAGLLVTAINLVPMGQLDGGHVIYALFPEKSELLYKLVFAAFLIFAAIKNHAWLVFLALVFFLVRLKHPPTLDEVQPLGWQRFLFGILALVFFVLTFPPVPFQFGP
ncbi:MAG: site-2 protease family protein [Acidobacteriota bacterium]